MDFGRQAQPVEVIIVGEPADVEVWTRELARRASYKGDQAQINFYGRFKIYPRTNND